MLLNLRSAAAMLKKVSFSPIIDAQAKILILGSLPGDKSLTLQEYYGHPQNRFWKLIGMLLNFTPNSSYSAKITQLQSRQVALWDVCGSAFRPGSMDSDIQQVSPNAIPELLAAYPAIHTIFFNGQKAETLFNKHFNRDPKLHYIKLPSTSPANATYRIEDLLVHWQQIPLSLKHEN